MTWTAPKTFTANSTLTAADLNTYLRDNSLETVPAIATTPGAIYVSDGLNSVAERIPAQAYIATSEGTTSSTYTNLATVGPVVTVSTGTRALVFLYANISNSSASTGSIMSYQISSATSVAPDPSTSLIIQSTSGNRVSFTILHTGLTAGSNVFTAKYRTVTATTTTATFADRRMAVIPL